MTDRAYWKRHPLHPVEGGTPRSVYIRGTFAPFFGWMALPDTAFSCRAYIVEKGKRIYGYVGQAGDDRVQTFYRYTDKEES